MAKVRRMRPEWAVKVIMMIVVASILLRGVSAAKNHSVGGSSGWDLSSNVQAWSATTTFHVGDSLVFKYTPAHDVLEVDHQAFTTCSTTNPISTDSSGETVIQLTRQGTRYFMCGRRGHCALGLKLQADVLPELESTSNETSRSGGGGRRTRQPPPSTSPPSPLAPNLPSPLPHTPDLSIPESDVVLPSPSPDENQMAPSPCPCKNSGIAGMIKVDRWSDYRWVSDSTLLPFISSLLLSGFSIGLFLFW